MADISLTASMRSNLLSLQQTQDLMDQTQERLSTGKKVNSAIDNPSSYYTAQSLTNRASDLSSLLDSMGQGIQTIQAANEAIESITTFAEQLKSIANSARDISNNMKTKVSSKSIDEEKQAGSAGKIYVDSREDMSTGNVNVGTTTGTQTLKFFIDGTEHNVEYTGDATANTAAQNLRDAIKAAGIEGLEVGGSDANVTLTAEGKAITIATDANHTGGTAIAGTDVTATDTAASIAGKVTGTASAKVEDGRFVVEASNTATVGNQIHVAVSGGAKDLLGSSFGGVIDTEVTDEEAIAERNKYVEQYNEVLEQIDALAKDASYKGINLLQENDLKVVFNEDRSSSIEIKGVDASSKGLGLETIEKRGWDMDAAIDDAITQVEGAITELRSMASDFGNNYSIVQTREDFTENLINVLEEGADKLTLADMNEEGANMLALQTRQQLAVNSLSLASQASQAVLQLF